MKKKLHNILPKSEFAKNVLTLMTGTSIAQAIPIAISPILTRIYSPEDFGVLALYGSILGILVTFSNGGYESAIVQPKRKKEAVNILGLGFNISLIFLAVVSLIILFFNERIIDLLDNKEFGNVIYFIPISLFLMSFYKLLNYFNIKEKAYKNISKSSVYRSSSLSLFQLIFGFFNLGYVGLVLGQIISQITNDIVLFKPLRKYLRLLSPRKQKELAVEYQNFPKYLMWSGSLNTASSQLPIMLITKFFGNAIVGYFSFSQRIIFTPVSLIGNSIGQVFYQKSAEIKEDSEGLRKLTFNMYKKLFYIGVVPFLILTFYSDYIFAFVFGEKWRIAGQYTQVLAPSIFFVFITSPLSTIFITLGRQKENLFFNILIFISRVGAILVGYYYFKSSDNTILLYGGIGLLFWCLWSFYMLKLVGVSYKESSIFSFKYAFVGILFFGGIRFLIESF